MPTADPMSDTNELVERLTEIANRDEAKTVTIRTDDLREVIAALAPVEAVPVAYQQRESRDDGKTWSDWYPTTREAFEEYTRNEAARYVSGKWTFEVRALYAHPPAQAGAVELGPDGKEWAKTEAAYAHVENVKGQALLSPSGLTWHGHVVREAFVAGAEWQEARSSAQAGAVTEAMEKLAAEFEREWGYDDDLRKSVGLETIGQQTAKRIRAALAAASLGAQGWRDECATEGCRNRATVHFERGGIGSYYCASCYLKVQAIPPSTAPVNQREGADRG